MRRTFSRRSCRDSNSQPLDHESCVLPTSYSGSRKLSLSLSLSLSYVRQEQSTLTLKYFLKNCVCTAYRFRLFDFLHANLCVQFFVFNSHLWRAHSQITNFEKFNYTPSFTRYSTCIRLMSTQIRQTIYRQACAQQSDCLKKHRLSGCLISKRAPVLSKLSSGNSRTSS